MFETVAQRPIASQTCAVPNVVFTSRPEKPSCQSWTVVCGTTYPDHWDVRLVSSAGTIKWRNQFIFLSSNLAGEYVGLSYTEADLVAISYGPLQLGNFDCHTNDFIPGVRWNG